MTTFYLETYGCPSNLADSEQMAGLLKEAKFSLVEQAEEADIVLFNTCAASPAVIASFLSRLESFKKENPYKIIVIAGCIPQADVEGLKGLALVGKKQIHRVVEVVEEALNNNNIKLLNNEDMPPLDQPRIRTNPVKGIIPISREGLGTCVFCRTGRGIENEKTQSYPPEEIVKVAARFVQEGAKLIWLASPDGFSYGLDLKTNLPFLLKELLKIPGNFKIRMDGGDPASLSEIKDELFPLLNHEKMYQSLHLSFFSGSDKVLNEMKRKGTKESFLSLADELKKISPLAALSTDILVGYPTETEDDYWQTLDLVRKLSPDVLNISRFWLGSKSSLSKMKPLPGEVVEHRSQVLAGIFQNISKLQNERWLDWEGEVLVEEKGEEAGHWIGRNQSYKPVFLKGDFKLGDVVKVRIVKAEKFNLVGEVVAG